MDAYKSQLKNLKERKAQLTDMLNENKDYVEILSNTPDLQGVKHNKLGIVQLAFYKSGEVEIGNGQKVKMDSQGMAMLKMDGVKVKELTVADPSRNLSRILLTIPNIYNNQGNGFTCLPNAKDNSTMVIVDLPQGVYLGKSVTVKF